MAKSTPKKPTAKKKTRTRAVFDVAHPKKGSLTTSSTSRSIIGGSSVLPDPMVMIDTKPTGLPLAPTKKKVVLTPLHSSAELRAEDDTAPTPTPAPEPALAPEPTSAPPLTSTSKPKAKPKPKTQEEKTVAAPKVVIDDTPVPVTPETKVADVAPETPAPVAIPEEHAAREEEIDIARKRAARLQKMIEDEEYFLPIKTLEERRSRKVAIIGLLVILLLAAAWYNVALDAGLLPNTYDLPHTSLFTVK